MSEIEIFHMYSPQIMELIVICQDMNQKEYESWKTETMETTPMEAIAFMEKIVMVVAAFRKVEKMKKKENEQPKNTGRERIYSFLVNFIKENGYAPSIREICAGSGLNSTSTVYNHLEMLEMMGKIKMKRNSSRAIKLVGYEFRKVEG